jgi:hypothetical protein
MALEHIKIPNVGTRIGYNVAAGTPSLSIPFSFFSPSDIVVTNLTTGLVLTLNQHYTVVGNGGFDKGFPGGTVNFLQPPAANYVIVIERQVPIERMVDFPNSGPLQTAALNTELDKGIAIDQQLKTDINALDSRIDILELGDPRLGRAMLFPPEDLALNHSLPPIAGRNQRTLGFATDGNIEMRSAITLPDIAHDEMLPPASGRINKVLGWDATGGFINLVDVVAGTLVPNADNITYQANGSTVSRAVGDVLRERLSIKDFGTQVGEGVQANDDAALAAAITYINAAPGAGLTLFYPAGVYFHGPCAVKLKRTYCTIEGDGTNSAFVVFTGPGTWITIGDQATPATPSENIGFRNFTLQLQTTTGLFFLLENTINVRFENIRLVSADGFLRLGVIGAGPTTAYHTYVRNCGGTSRNTGGALIACRYGGGLYIDLSNFALDGTGASGKNFLDFLDSVNFVVVRVTTCFVVNYNSVCQINLIGGGTVADIIFATCSLVNCSGNIFFLSSPGGASIRGVRVALCAMNTPTGTCIFLIGNGINDEHNFINNGFLESGGSAIAGNSTALHIVVSGNRIKNCNKTNVAEGAIHITSGTGWNICDNVGNDAESTYRAAWGIIMAAGMDRYIVTGNRMGGTTGSIKADPDGIASHMRRIVNNGFTFAGAGFNGYAIIAAVSPDASGNVVNNTPFVCDAIVSGSGFVGATSINGIPIGDATTGCFHLEPGDTLNVQADAAAVTLRRYE